MGENLPVFGECVLKALSTIEEGTGGSASIRAEHRKPAEGDVRRRRYVERARQVREQR
ncbi:MAG: hypothetical protein AVDCRST_MAG25-3039 [uncultured Rubrobacteraceae bacterium]|uniref:Uncharacterized protein n=1 Tax=uncultured Rubrobacteraceae bacterium TaxID=349277 RepID=A0A6J4S5E6_9ACTN|nr:MAG: hypothetical protein AVDCRST_MAG25-3039 [uncultured Rubrobacteraceae bacterium]